MKFIKRTIFIIAIISLIIAGVIYTNIAYYGSNSKPVQSEAMIVLGCQIWGTSPSWSLEYRLKKALELYQQGYAKTIIVSGGQGKDEAATESSVMKNWLIQQGIASDCIFEESKSTSTYENLQFSKEILENQKLNSAIIVSNDFHIFRSLSLAKRLGIEASGAPAPTVPHLKFYYNCREIISVIKSYFFDK
ncbi:MAG: YdcF family protein [Clostridia bacterium]|nr:YdcF family protein [Clostridia bacterium]